MERKPERIIEEQKRNPHVSSYFSIYRGVEVPYDQFDNTIVKAAVDTMLGDGKFGLRTTFDEQGNITQWVFYAARDRKETIDIGTNPVRPYQH